MKYSALALLSVGLAALLCLIAGCSDKAAPPPAPARSEFDAFPLWTPGSHKAAPPESPSQGRLTAALAISDTSKRDNALGAVADFAAQGGDAETVKKAVLQIGNLSKRDDVADLSALALAKAGKRADAAAIAGLMGNTTKRDNTLSKLAEQ